DKEKNQPSERPRRLCFTKLNNYSLLHSNFYSNQRALLLLSEIGDSGITFAFAVSKTKIIQKIKKESRKINVKININFIS
ncbi:MAG: hypothetical protein AB1668_06810, partial [Nanoarchaeota archaeon]